MTEKFLKLLAIAIVFASISTSLYANQQGDEPTQTVANSSLSLSGQGLFYSYERPLTKTLTVEGRAGFQVPIGYAKGTVYPGLGYVGYGYRLGVTTADGFFLAIHPYLEVTPRYYYNLEKRERKGKNTAKNSANYLAFTAQYAFNPIVSYRTYGNSLVAITPHWGLRRVYNDSFLFEFALGAMYSIDGLGNKDLNLFADLRFGYAF